jgi:molybdate transport system ATP-binding protein
MIETRPESHADVAPTVNATGARLEAQFQKRFAEFALDVNFSAGAGFNILFGASGAGKTTLLDCISGLTTPDSGRIALGNRVLFDATTSLPVEKRRVGYVFQNLALFLHLSVQKNVEYGLAHLPAAQRHERATAMLQAFRIAHLARRSAREISGGESQRVALARTLVTDPAVLLLDEPLAALDAATKTKIIDDLREWNRAHRIPVLYVTHSREEVFALGERVLMLEAGRIVAEGTPHEVMMAPMRETVAQLAGFENIFDATVEAVHPERGTMICRIEPDASLAGGAPNASCWTAVMIETPLVRGGVGAHLRVGIRAGDILLATSPPAGLSARNVIPGRITSLDQRDVIVVVHVNCRIEMEVHLTLAARDSLQLVVEKEVWLVIKTHSCHLMRDTG